MTFFLGFRAPAVANIGLGSQIVCFGGSQIVHFRRELRLSASGALPAPLPPAGWPRRHDSRQSAGPADSTPTSQLALPTRLSPVSWPCQLDSRHSAGPADSSSASQLALPTQLKAVSWPCRLDSHQTAGPANSTPTCRLALPTRLPPNSWLCRHDSHHSAAPADSTPTSQLALPPRLPLGSWPCRLDSRQSADKFGLVLYLINTDIQRCWVMRLAQRTHNDYREACICPSAAALLFPLLGQCWPCFQNDSQLCLFELDLFSARVNSKTNKAGLLSFAIEMSSQGVENSIPESFPKSF